METSLCTDHQYPLLRRSKVFAWYATLRGKISRNSYASKQRHSSIGGVTTRSAVRMKSHTHIVRNKGTIYRFKRKEYENSEEFGTVVLGYGMIGLSVVLDQHSACAVACRIFTPWVSYGTTILSTRLDTAFEGDYIRRATTERKTLSA